MKSSSVGGTEREMAIISLGRCCVLKWLVSNGSLFGRQFIDDGPLDFFFFFIGGARHLIFHSFFRLLYLFLILALLKILKFKKDLWCWFVDSLRPMRSRRQRSVQRDDEGCWASVRNAMLSRGVRRWVQWRSEQPVRRLQTRHPQRRMPIRLSSWPLLGKNFSPPHLAGNFLSWPLSLDVF